MKKRRKQRKMKKVLIILSIIMIVVGGIIIMKKSFFNDSKGNENKRLQNNSNNGEKIENNEEKIQDNFHENSQTNNQKITKITNKAPINNGDYQNLNDGEYLTDKGYTLKIENGIATIDSLLIVNKTYSLPSTFKPNNPNSEITSEKCISCLDKDVIEAFNLMKSDANSIGLNIWIQSGYRSYTYQETLYNNYTMVSGVDGADTYSARAGHSEHQTGLCFDLNTIDDSFAYTDEGKWINNNAHLYGFIIRYPKGKESITGYQYESWHLRYVGKTLAKVLYNEGNWITIEEHFGLSSVY